MKAINFMNLEELYIALWKKCEVSFSVIRFPSESLTGILTKIELNTQDNSPRIVIQLEDVSISMKSIAKESLPKLTEA